MALQNSNLKFLIFTSFRWNSKNYDTYVFQTNLSSRLFWLIPSLALNSLWPKPHFSPKNTSAPKILRPDVYFDPETLQPETTSA